MIAHFKLLINNLVLKIWHIFILINTNEVKKMSVPSQHCFFCPGICLSFVRL